MDGWLSDVDVHVIWLLNEWQRQAGIDGDILEIGVFMGKSAILLGHLLEDSENLEVCDVFDRSASLSSANADENRLQYSGLTRAAFERTFLQHHDRVPVIHPIPSAELPQHLGQSRFRVIHIDGSHLYENVRGDIAFSGPRLVEGGIVILDDWSHSDHPGVAAATWEAILAGALVPVVTTDMKLYGFWKTEGGNEVAGLQAHLERSPYFEIARHEIADAALLQVRLRGWTREASREL